MAVSWIKVILLTLGKPKILLTLHKSKLTLKQVNKILVPLPTLNKSNFRQKSSNFTDFKQDSQSGCLWLPTPHCAAPVWLTGHHVTPLVTRYFPPTLYRKCYGFERAFFNLKHFLPCTPSCWFWGFPGAGSSTSKLWFHADHCNIVPAQILHRMTAIHKRGIWVGFI